MNKPQTKYDCPFYEAKGGHCKKRSYDYGFMRNSFGCNCPDDISKCFYAQKAIKDSPFLKG